MSICDSENFDIVLRNTDMTSKIFDLSKNTATLAIEQKFINHWYETKNDNIALQILKWHKKLSTC